MSQDTTYNSIILAALLHDIGKPLCDAINISAKGIDEHVNFSVAIIEHLFEGIERKELIGYDVKPTKIKMESLDIKLVKTLVVEHHNKDSNDSTLTYIKKADHWSASEESADSSDPSPMLESPFKRIGGEKEGPYYYWPEALTKNKLPKNIFSKTKDPSPDKKLLQTRCKDLITDIGYMTSSVSRQGADFQILLSLLDLVLCKHLWLWPSSRYKDVRDIPLYDHLKVTSAIAAVLYSFQKENESDDIEKAQAFKLLLMDFSGIQKYIFDIKTKRAAKRLRARSFYVQALCDNIGRHILKKLDLPQTCQLQSAGGKICILFPAHKDGVVGEIAAEIQSELFSKFRGEIVLNAATSDAFKGDQFSGKEGAYRKLYDSLQARLEKNKKQQFKAVLLAAGKWNSTQFVHALPANSRECDYCGKPDKTEEDDGKICPRCKEDKEIGEALVKSGCIAFEEESIIPRMKVVKIGEDKKTIEKAKHLTAINLEIFEDFGKLESHLRPLNVKLMANYVTKGKKDNVLDFEDIAEQSQGVKMLGVLKADVDDLGRIIGERIEKERFTITRMAMLSRMLDIFFSGYIETLVREKYDYCYCVYSGGDDLLIIGPWDNIIELSLEINGSFKEFAGGNPGIHLSAGMAFVKHSYPVLNAVELAGAQLKIAKNNNKNSVALWDHAVKWDDFRGLKPAFDMLAQSLNGSKGGKLSTGFVYNLLQFGRMQREYKDGDKSRIRWKPMLAYQLGRQNAGDKLEFEFCGKENFAAWLKRILSEEGKAGLERDNLDIMAQYALYKNRGNG